MADPAVSTAAPSTSAPPMRAADIEGDRDKRRATHAGTPNDGTPRHPYDRNRQSRAERSQELQEVQRDPRVSRGIGMYFAQLSGAASQYFVRPAGGEQASREARIIAAFCAEALGIGLELPIDGRPIVELVPQLDGGLERRIEPLLWCPWEGVALAERIPKRAASAYVSAADIIAMRGGDADDDGVAIFWDQLYDIIPDTITRWGVADGEVRYIEQSYQSGQPYHLPLRVDRERLFVVTWRQRGDNVLGQGWLDVIRAWALSKRRTAKATDIAADRVAHPIPRVRMNYARYAELFQLSPGSDSLGSLADKVESSAANARQQEDGVMRDSDVAELGTWPDKPLQVDGATDWMDQVDGQIDAVTGAGYVDMDTAGGGVLAAQRAGVHASLILDVANAFCNAIDAQLLAPLVRWTFGAQALHLKPLVSHTGLDAQNIVTAIQAGVLPQLAQTTPPLVDAERLRPAVTTIIGGRRREREIAPPGDPRLVEFLR